MIIQKGKNLYGLGENFHLRIVEDGLRVDRNTIPADDPAEAFEKVNAAAAKGETYVDLDAKPAKEIGTSTPEEEAKEAPANAKGHHRG